MTDTSSTPEQRIALDPTVLRNPQNFHTILASLRPTQWPPTDAGVQRLSDECASFIAALDAWESMTEGASVVDTVHGQITTAMARRLLAHSVLVSEEGHISVLLIPGGNHRVHVELRGDVDAQRGAVRRPELVLSWEQDEEEHVFYSDMHPKGPQWYMLSQLRDDAWEGRLNER